MLYGLKCVVALHGKMLLSVRGAVYSSFHLVPVSGTVAATVGLVYVGLALFVYLSDGSPPSENRVWLWRLGRGLLRWGSLGVSPFCFVEADKWVTGRVSTLAGFPSRLRRKGGSSLFPTLDSDWRHAATCEHGSQ